MEYQRLKSKLKSLLGSIDLLVQNRQTGPALILLYATIDILAWLNRNESHEDVERSDFIAWSDMYLLPNIEIRLTSLDLYASRCSMLHSYSAESRLSREGQASEIYYSWGSANSEELQSIIDASERKAIAVQFEDLLSALRFGIEQFVSEIRHSVLVLRRSEKLFANIRI